MDNDNVAGLKAEMTRLKAELRRTTDERDILKNPPRTLTGRQSNVLIPRPHRYQ